VLENQYGELEEKQARMQEDFKRIQAERDELYNNFEQSVRAVQEQSDHRNVMLNHKIQQVEDNIERTSRQAGEVVGSASLDPAEVARVTQAVDEALLDRNKMIRELQYMVTRAAKVRHLAN
jgi:growth arrest-specific protein 8